MDSERLAAWEEQLMAVMADAAGDATVSEQRLAGIQAEYRAVVTAYSDLLTEPASAREALTRATFLVWYAYAEPEWLSGVGAAPPATEWRVLAALDTALRVDPPATELALMAARYARVLPVPFAQHPDLPALHAFAVNADADADEPEWQPTEAVGRGQLGNYWASMRRDA
jgi:hypothetical protein